MDHNHKNEIKATMSLGCLRCMSLDLFFHLSFCFFQSVLGYEVRKPGSPHNCLDDACAAMKLVLAKIKREIGDIIPPVQEDVSFLIFHYILNPRAVIPGTPLLS